MSLFRRGRIKRALHTRGAEHTQRLRHPRAIAGFFMLVGAACLLFVLHGCFPAETTEYAGEDRATTLVQTEQMKAAQEEILEQVRNKEALSAGEVSAVKNELKSALGDGNLHIQTAMHASGLTESVNGFLTEEKEKADDVLIWSGYLGLLGKSWGALLKTSQGVEIVTFSEILGEQEETYATNTQDKIGSVTTFEERASLYQGDWT